jgi:hypothetical protein
LYRLGKDVVHLHDVRRYCGDVENQIDKKKFDLNQNKDGVPGRGVASFLFALCRVKVELSSGACRLVIQRNCQSQKRLPLMAPH